MAATRHALGETPGGLKVGYWTLPETVDTAAEGTQGLVEVLAWLEETLGPYAFGDTAGPVAVDWGFLAAGGIEHHPFWHVSTPAMDNRAVHAHEAAHGWFGNGVRLECWEDLVLSEGTADYLSARVIEVVWGAEAAEEVWATYETRLNQVFHFELDHVAWPDETCMAIDVLGDGLFSPVPYVKGALFYRAVAENVGAPELDRVLGMFVALHRGGTGLFRGTPGGCDLVGSLRTPDGTKPGNRLCRKREGCPGPEAGSGGSRRASWSDRPGKRTRFRSEEFAPPRMTRHPWPWRVTVERGRSVALFL